jgi:hypothetical protein
MRGAKILSKVTVVTRSHFVDTRLMEVHDVFAPNGVPVFGMVDGGGTT